MEEKNYIKIPNEILEALARTRLSNYEFRFIWVLLRKTFGWNKKSDYIANSQFVKETGIKKPHISRTKKRLIWRKIVAKRGNKLSLSANYGEWKKLPIQVTVTNRGHKVTKVGGHKEHYTKNIIPKGISNSSVAGISSFDKSNLFIKGIITFFRQIAKEERSIDPEINFGASAKRIKQLTERKENPLSLEELKEIIKFYFTLEKSTKFAISLTSALSTDTLNLWKQNQPEEIICENE